MEQRTDYNRAPVSTLGLWHYPATITDTTTTWEVASFAPDAAGQFKTKTTGAVINNFGGRLQMVWFMGWATDWAKTSNYLNHVWIQWMTRGLCKSYTFVSHIQYHADVQKSLVVDVFILAPKWMTCICRLTFTLQVDLPSDFARRI